jgi:hypothetical protein
LKGKLKGTAGHGFKNSEQSDLL